MADVLPRVKPDPIPTINPIPEHQVTGELAAVYDHTKKGFGVPWMGVVAMAFAHFPKFYACLCSVLEPTVTSQAFAVACRTLRTTAETEAAKLEPPGILRRLEGIGYSPRELDDIRACNDVFSDGNMPYLLMATIARLLLEGRDWIIKSAVDPRGIPPSAPERPVLIEPHHADPTIQALYEDIRTTLGLPFVNTDYRAFARWPSYLAMAWSDLKQAVERPEYDENVRRIHDKAVQLALSLPMKGVDTSETLRLAARQDAELEEVTSVVRLFQWLLPGLTINVAFLRAQLNAGNK